MRLRRPCEHGRYDEHQVPSGGYSKHPHYSPEWTTCPGGEFLADDTLIIERSSETIERLADALYEQRSRRTMWREDWKLNAVAVLDALAVREGER